jgi:hypothetical protein
MDVDQSRNDLLCLKDEKPTPFSTVAASEMTDATLN